MKIVFSGGGTAGHVTPNIALIDKLLDEEIYYIGSDGMEKKLTSEYVKNGKILKYYEISAHKLQRKLTFKNLLLPFQLIKSINQAKNCLKEIRPDAVFSKGGYVGLPVIIAAKSLKIPSIIHESDISLGLANKISARYATEFLASFPCDKRAKVIGMIIRDNILRGDRQKGLAAMGFDGKRPVLLVTGGSLGANALNNAICNNLCLKDKFDVFVISGKGKKINADIKQAEFVDNMPDVMAAADVCLTRAGSNSLAELTLSLTPFVTVPLEKCSRGEQIKNADWFCSRGCGVKIGETKLNEKLVDAVNAVYNNRQAIITKQRQQKSLYGTDAAAAEILKYKKD